MSNLKEDTDNNIRTTFLLILFSLLVFVSSNNHGNNSSLLEKDNVQSAFVFADISSHHNTIICNTDRLPDLQKYYELALNNTGLNPFSVQYLISDFNNRIAQNLILVQKTRRTIEPLLLWRLQNTLSMGNTSDLPALS